MRRLCLALLFTLAAAAQVDVTVHLYNNAGLPPAQLQQAMRLAARIYEPIGVNLRWELCPQQCPEPAGKPVYLMGLAGPQVEMPNAAALGFSMLAAGKGNRAAVSIPRVEAFAEAWDIAVLPALAYSIAHELGHLILRSRHHSNGVMAATWNRQNALQINQSRLSFSARDTAALRAALRAAK